MTEDGKNTEARKQSIRRELWGEPVFESNNPKGIIASRNRGENPSQPDNAGNDQSSQS